MAKKKASPAPTPSATNPPAATPAPAGPMTFDRHQRWRLILGKRVEDQLCGGGGAGMGGRGGGGLLTREMAEMDASLGALYDIEETDPGNGSGLALAFPKNLGARPCSRRSGIVASSVR